MKNKIQYTTVKIIVDKNGNINSGSGTIIKKGDNFYVITAEHCIFGKKEDREKFRDVTTDDISIEFRYKFDDSPTKISTLSIEEVCQPQDYIILQITPPNIDFDFSPIVFGYFSNEKEQKSIFRGYAKAHINEPRTYDCIIKEKSNKKLLCSLRYDSFFQAENSGAEVAGGISGSGIFYSENNVLFLIGIITELRDERATYDDFYALSVDSISFLSDSIKPVESTLIAKSADDFLTPLQNKLGIPNVDFILNSTDSPFIDIHISKRGKTINKLFNQLAGTRWLAISGAVYSGKTELLKLINETLIDSKSIFIKIQPNESEESIIQRIQVALSEDGREFLILDNLPQLGKDSRLLDFIILILTKTSIRIISGSRYSLPSKINTNSNISQITVPDFTEDEVKEIIRSYNQPQDIVNPWCI